MRKSVFTLLSLIVLSLFIVACAPSEKALESTASEGAKEIVKEEPVEEVVEEPADVVEEVAEEAEAAGSIHTVKVTDAGFNPDQVSINAGDTVVWENVRTGKINNAMILGTKLCTKIKSEIFAPGETFEWTFDDPEPCTIVDGIYTNKVMKVLVEE